MLTSLLDTQLNLMTLGAQAHNALNSAMIDEIAIMMKSSKWTCHKCQTQLPGMMEVDHLKGHKVSSKDAIAPICQVCHDREHLLWAGSRKRITLIHAPDLTYPEISQLTWSIISNQGMDGFDIDRTRVTRTLKSRQEDAFDALGHNNLEAIFEGILTMVDIQGEESVRKLLSEIDSHIKIAPSILLDEEAEIQIWSSGGFRPPSEGWQKNATSGRSTGYEALRNAGEALKSRL